MPLHNAPYGKIHGRAHGNLPITLMASDCLLRLTLLLGVEAQQKIIADELSICFILNIIIMSNYISFMFFGKRFDIGRTYIRLLAIIFLAALLAKGSVIFRGYAIDDYVLWSGINSEYLAIFFSQGRYVAAAIVWIIDSIGANINDMYFSLGIVALFLQAAFVVSILRFVGVADSPAASLVGAIMVAHPYLTEILSFRMALPFYSVALFFSIIALEMAAMRPATWGTRALSIFSTFAMLITYQVFLNYFAVAILFAFIYGMVSHNKSNPSLPTSVSNVYRERAITLTIICTISAFAFVFITWLGKSLGITEGTGRANFISFDKIPERIEQISSSLVSIYWSAEPVFPGWLKALVALLLAASVVIIFKSLLTNNGKENYISNAVFAFLASILLIPFSLGVIIPFDDWWPVPRVIAHVPIIIGLVFIVAISSMQDMRNRFIQSMLIISGAFVFVGFMFLSNQILADQQRVNQWDRMMANRIVSRLELHPDFGNVKFVYMYGGSWGYPAKLRTIQGDMNISAFSPDYSKVRLLSEVSGYRFERAIGPMASAGQSYCMVKQPWPHEESITVDDDVAFICLRK